MKTFTVQNTEDPNDNFSIEADDWNDAYHVALEEIGWWVSSNKDDDDFYTVINDNDGNDTFEVNAHDCDHAAYLALEELGWVVVNYP